MALKTVGLLTLMVQSGLLVPVREGSIFSVFSDVEVDIGDGQSIEHALSTFSAHIKNMIGILDSADPSTLVLIDEMASGTDPGEGVGLSIAILEELHRRQSTVVATTHFNEIKSFASGAPGFMNARMEFNPDTLEPLYRLRIGEAGQSYAFMIARKLGLPAAIIERSKAIAAGNGSARASGEGFSGVTHAPNPAETADTFSMDHAHAVPDGTSTAVYTASDGKPQRPLAATASAPDTTFSNPVKEPAPKTPPFRLGDCVHIGYMDRTGIVCEVEDPKGMVGVLIQGQRFKINRKRLKLYIAGKELYPADYDFDIVFETKENRKKRKLMSRKYVPGLTIEKSGEE